MKMKTHWDVNKLCPIHQCQVKSTYNEINSLLPLEEILFHENSGIPVLGGAIPQVPNGQTRREGYDRFVRNRLVHQANS
jgi:hypothetical protein